MCKECRHHPCVSGCPNYEPKRFWTCCAECGSHLYIGDTAYKMGDNYYCEECVTPLELEEPERDEDYEYERWRDQRLIEERS